MKIVFKINSLRQFTLIIDRFVIVFHMNNNYSAVITNNRNVLFKQGLYYGVN